MHSTLAPIEWYLSRLSVSLTWVVHLVACYRVYTSFLLHRHALVPQPEHPPAPSRSNSGPDTGSNSRHNSGPDVRSGSRHNSGPDAGSGGRRNSGPDAGSSGRRNSGPSNQPGFFQSVFGSLAGHENHSLNSGGRPGSYTDSPRPSSRRPPTPHTHTRRGSGPSSSRRNTGRDNLPGSWSEDLD